MYWRFLGYASDEAQRIIVAPDNNLWSTIATQIPEPLARRLLPPSRF